MRTFGFQVHVQSLNMYNLWTFDNQLHSRGIALSLAWGICRTSSWDTIHRAQSIIWSQLLHYLLPRRWSDAAVQWAVESHLDLESIFETLSSKPRRRRTCKIWIMILTTNRWRATVTLTRRKHHCSSVLSLLWLEHWNCLIWVLSSGSSAQVPSFLVDSLDLPERYIFSISSVPVWLEPKLTKHVKIKKAMARVEPTSSCTTSKDHSTTTAPNGQWLLV